MAGCASGEVVVFHWRPSGTTPLTASELAEWKAGRGWEGIVLGEVFEGFLSFSTVLYKFVYSCVGFSTYISTWSPAKPTIILLILFLYFFV